jgi:hypothetical protein
MRVASDTGDVLELETRSTPGDADLALTVRVSCDGFLGETHTWVERHDWFAFVQALTILEERRSRDANAQSVSPGELNLTVRALDRLGHMGIEGLIGRREFDRKVTLHFSVFSFEPSQLVAFTREARRISEVLASPRMT